MREWTPHSQTNSHFGNWNPNGFPNFHRVVSRVKTHWIEKLFIPLKALESYIFKMGSHDSFGYLNNKLWLKEVLGVNCQFDSQPLKVKNRPDLLVFRWPASYRWKALDKVYKFASNLISIGGLHKKLWASKVVGVPISRISRLPTWESQDKMTFGCRFHGHAQKII